MRMCSLTLSVQAAQSMNTAPNRYQCSSSQALDETPKTRRMMALIAETRTAAADRPGGHLAEASVDRSR